MQETRRFAASFQGEDRGMSLLIKNLYTEIIVNDFLC